MKRKDRTAFQHVECRGCGYYSCVCGLRLYHDKECKLRVSAECPVGIECPHGFDVCPQCDPCTCKSPQKHQRP